jgi:hypothetical protein
VYNWLVFRYVNEVREFLKEARYLDQI